MTRLDWVSAGSRFYETGIDRGVLFVGSMSGVAWIGLTSVDEKTSGGDAKPFYVDGTKYLNTSTGEEFEATIKAFTYPPEFGQCDGTRQPRLGLFLTQQRRMPFGLTYRTKVGNDVSSDYGYKIHIIYNAMASPTGRTNSTTTNELNPMDFSWDITTRPPVLAEYKPSAHLVIDSRFTDPSVLSLLEDTLYGNDSDDPVLPTFDEILAIFDTVSSLVVTDNADGTFTAEAPGDVIRMLDDTTFEITSETAVFIDDDSYTLSSGG